jgi:hypothetical protein
MQKKSFKVCGDYLHRIYELTYKEVKELGLNPYNRGIDKKHVEQMKNKLMDSPLKKFVCPIIVNLTTGNIIDGQHRATAFCEMIENGSISTSSTIDVIYKEMHFEDEIRYIDSVNSDVKNWQLTDAVNSKAKQNIDSYKMLLEFCKTHSLCHANNGTPKATYASIIILGKRPPSKLLRGGDVNFSKEQVEKAHYIHDEMVDIFKAIGIKSPTGWMIGTLAEAWHEVRNRYDFDTWLKAFEKSKGNLQDRVMTRKKDWELIIPYVESQIPKGKRLF